MDIRQRFIIGVIFVEDGKKYYWLKLKKDFFKRHDIMILESMPNGKEYALLYMKLLLESIDHDGTLRFNDSIPYNENMLSTITSTNIDIVRTAMKVFQQLKLVEIYDDETIYMTEVNKMLGCETAWAEKKRQYRLNKEDNVTNLSLPSPIDVRQEIELEKEIELELDTEKEIDKDFNTNSKSKANKPKQLDIDQQLYASGYDDDVLQYISDYIDMRKSIKKPMSSGSVKHFLNALKRLPDQRPAYLMKALEISILRNYLSVFEIKNERDLPPEEKIAYVEERDPNENISWFDPRFDPNACCRKTSVSTGT